MILAIDFDGTIVSDEHAYDDLKTPLRFMPGARQSLLRMKTAGHILILWSGRSNPWLRDANAVDPLVSAGVRKSHKATAERSRQINQERYEQMLAFVKKELPGVFALVWEHTGKPSADVFIDDRAAPFALEGWRGMVDLYGAAEPRTLGA
jgi:hypothetical protein